MNKQKMTFLVHRIAGENNLSFNTALVYKYRKTPMNADELNNAIIRIEENSLMENRWNTYTKANNYARDISFRQAMDACKQLVNMLEVEVV